MRPSVTRCLQTLLIGGTALCLAAPAAADDAAGNPQVVKIHADWCGTCVKLNPTWEALREKHADSVDFIILDVTNDITRAAAENTAEQRGLDRVFETYGGRTGTVLVMRAAAGEPVAVLKGKTDVADYDEPIARARES